MAELKANLHEAVSNAIVDVCRKLLENHTTIKITGSVTFDIDGEEVKVVISEETTGQLTGQSATSQPSCDHDKQHSSNAQLTTRVKCRQRSRPRKKTLRGRRQRSNKHTNHTAISASTSAAAAADVNTQATNNDGNFQTSTSNGTEEGGVSLDQFNQYLRDDEDGALTKSNNSDPAAVDIKAEDANDYEVKARSISDIGRDNRRRYKRSTSRQCRNTDTGFLSSDELTEHVETSHSNTTANSFTSKSGFTARQTKSHLMCKTCGYQCSTQRAFQCHIAGHDGSAKPRVACDECDKTFTSTSTLYHHKRAMHSSVKPYECTQCDARFNFNHSLKLHVLKHAGKRPHHCQICGKSYLTASHLKYHVEAIHSVTKRYICNVCHKSFPYETSYKLHRRLHTGERPFTCKTCGKTFVARGALREHEKTHTAGNSENQRQFRCDVCDRYYGTAALLRAHCRRHTSDISRHVCEVCGRTFMYRSNLEVHASVHVSERAFSCSTCGKSFKTASTLYTHQVVHKPDSVLSHICTNCGKAFKTKQRLRAHEFRHTGTKPYTCNSCGGSFPDRGGLSKHIRTVHAARARYACPLCRKTANRLDNLRVHMRTHADPGLLNLTAEELTASADDANMIFDKSCVTETTAEVTTEVPPVSIEGSASVPVNATFCILPSSVTPAKPSATSDTQFRLPRLSAGATTLSTGAGSMVDLFHDSSAYVQHCLSFVALPSTDYIAQADLTSQPQSLTYIHHQP